MTTHSGGAGFRIVGEESKLVASGEIDVAVSPEFRDLIDRLIDRGDRSITVDMAEVSFIDSSGLGVLVAAHKRIVDLGGVLRISTLQPGPRKVLEITGLLDVFEIE